jgi:FixJ family two-component response regulator
MQVWGWAGETPSDTTVAHRVDCPGACPGLPAVLLTGHAGDGAALATGADVAGAFSLPRKPVRIHELVDRIEALMAARLNAAR